MGNGFVIIITGEEFSFLVNDRSVLGNALSSDKAWLVGRA